MNIHEWSFGKRIYMNIIFSKCRVAFSSNFLFQKDCVALTVWETISGNFFWFLPETAFHPLWITVDSFVMQMRRAHRETAAKHSLLAFSVSLFHSSLLILIYFAFFFLILFFLLIFSPFLKLAIDSQMRQQGNLARKLLNHLKLPCWLCILRTPDRTQSMMPMSFSSMKVALRMTEADVRLSIFIFHLWKTYIQGGRKVEIAI